MSIFYRFCQALTWLQVSLLTRWRAQGRNNIPREGPVIVVANHMNLLDIPLLSASLNRQAIYMTKEELFQNWLSGYLLRHLDAFPVHRGQLDRTALRRALQALSKGNLLAIFPEGTRSRNGQLQPAFAGAALIALHSGAPILPAGITGTEKAKGKAWILRHPRIAIKFGIPFYPPTTNQRVTKKDMADLTESIMRHIAELLPPEYHGYYAQEKGPKSED
ncbi:lysophospholipid acyltransferase family protein [Chloroflexota bacterium]